MVHDDRFRDALIERGHDIDSVVLTGRGWSKGDAGGHLDRSDWSCVVAGPLPIAARALESWPDLPMVAVCWGSDGFQPFDHSVLEVLKRSEVVVCDCSIVARRLIDAGAPSDRVAHFAWGIDLDLFRPSSSADERGQLRFITTRAFEPVYEHEMVLRAFASAVDRGCTSTLTMYGAGSLEEGLRALCAELGVQSLVDIQAPVPEAELANEFTNSTAWLNAARSDGICISLLQAMACGCGVVTTDLACAREAVGPGSASFFPAGDTEALTSALLSARRPSLDEAEVAASWLERFADWRHNRMLFVASVERALG